MVPVVTSEKSCKGIYLLAGKFFWRELQLYANVTNHTASATTLVSQDPMPRHGGRALALAGMKFYAGNHWGLTTGQS